MLLIYIQQSLNIKQEVFKAIKLKKLNKKKEFSPRVKWKEEWWGNKIIIIQNLMRSIKIWIC